MKKIEIRKYKKLKKYKNGLYYDDSNFLIPNQNKFNKFFIIIFLSLIIILFIFFIYSFAKRKSKKSNIIINSNTTETNTTEDNYLNYINVAYGFDHDYHYITHVSMKSIMLSQNSTTFINFYILVSNITTNQKEVIDRVGLQHKNCKIIYIDMGNHYKELNVPKDIYAVWSTANFYRISLPELLPNEHKILYLDVDTLIYKDLTKIYNYNITDKYFVGMLEYKYFGYAKYFPEKFKNYINTGVLLCNLDELRKGNISQKFMQFHEKFKKQIRYPVNDPLNIVTHEKNGYFDPEYVVIGFCDEEFAFVYYSRTAIKLNQTEVLKAYKDPYIYHLIYYSKPWNTVPRTSKKVCVDPFTRFFEMARKTDYYYEILDKFIVK